MPFRVRAFVHRRTAPRSGRPCRRVPGTPEARAGFPCRALEPVRPLYVAQANRIFRRLATPASSHRDRDWWPVSARRRAIPRGRCRASRPASSAPRAPPGADCRPSRPVPCRSSPPRSPRAGSRRPQPPRAARPRSRSGRRHGSSRRRSRAAPGMRRARCDRACRSASVANRVLHWPSSATCRLRPAPCWPARHGYGAADPDCGKCRAGRRRRQSSGRRRAPCYRYRDPSSGSRRHSSRPRRGSPRRRGRGPRRCACRRPPARRWRPTWERRR